MTRSSFRVAVRLGTGAARRGRWRSVLVVILIALPVLAMAGAVTLLATVTPTPEQTAIARMGVADLVVTPTGDGSVSGLVALLPARSRVEPVAQASGSFTAAGARYGTEVFSMNLDGLAKGIFTVLSGRAPQTAGEVAVSPDVLAISGVSIGDPITLTDRGPVTVVGTVENPMNLRMRMVLADAGLASAIGGPSGTTYLVALPPGTSAPDLPPSIEVDFGQAQVVGPGGDQVTQPSYQATTRAFAGQPSDTQVGVIFILGGLALVEAALIASAAFAVSIRRRQRELGLLGAVGGEPRHLATTVLAEAVVLGVAGAIVGVVVAIAAVLASGPLLDQLVDRRNPPVVISPVWLLISAAIGVGAALIAAAVPARTASRVPILAALSGRRPPTAPATRTLRLGLLTIGAAFLITLVGTGVQFRAVSGTPGLGIGLLLLGAVLGVLGFGACSPWLLERLERVASRLSLSPRLALRDTARARSRNGPIVTALLASFAATVAVAALLSSQQALAERDYQPSMRTDQIIVAGPGAASAGATAAQELAAIGSAPLTPMTAPDDSGVFLEIRDWRGNGQLVVGDESLLRALGAESALPDLRAGVAVVLAEQDTALGKAIVRSGDGVTILGTLPTRTVATGAFYSSLPGAVISPETAGRLGLQTVPAYSYLIRLPHPLTEQDRQRASALTTPSLDTVVSWETGLQRPGDAFRLILVIGSLLFALTVTGVAVALGEAEARPDQRTLLALGADPGVRRRITAARAGVLAAIAGLLAVPAGLLPVWGLLATRHSPDYPLVIPIPEVLVAMAILPLGAVVGAALLSRPISTWSTYRREGA